jgi:hypothetical protein
MIISINMEKIEISIVALAFVLFTIFIIYIPINALYRDVTYAMYS